MRRNRPVHDATDGLFPAGHPCAGLDPGITCLRDWPRRAALIVGAAPNPATFTAFHAHAFSTAVCEPARGPAVAAALAPFAFMIITPDCLADDEAIATVQAMHACSPSALVLLDCSPVTTESAVLVRALRAGVVDVVDSSRPDAVEAAIADGLRLAGVHRERVLAIGAHPDDVEIGCCGTLIDHRLRGDRISILTLSRGTVGGDQQRRVDESVATAEAIGAQLLFGDLPDTQVEDTISTIRLIESVVEATNPTVIYVHSKHDGHQDHRAVATATASATRGVRRIFAFQSPSATNDFRPTRFVGIDGVLQRKMQVLRMFDSQHGRSYLEPELVVAGSRYWARQLGATARYAEPFEVIRSVGDLRQSTAVGAHFVDSRPGFSVPSYSGVSPIRPDLVLPPW